MIRVPVKIILVPFLVPFWAKAQVLFPRTIFWRKSFPFGENLLAHELMHVRQIERYGLFRYWFRYLRLLIKHGYDNHPMEVEARSAIESAEMVRWASDILRERRERDA